MKKLLCILIGLISYFSVSAQSYPQYYIKNGDTLGVIISIEQAQKIDNDYDLLVLLKEAKIKCDSLDYAYIVVIGKLNTEIAELKLKVSTLEGLVSTRDNQIKNLQEQILKHERDSQLANQQSVIKDSVITNLTKENKKFKRQKIFGFSVGGGGLIGLILILLLK